MGVHIFQSDALSSHGFRSSGSKAAIERKDQHVSALKLQIAQLPWELNALRESWSAPHVTVEANVVAHVEGDRPCKFGGHDAENVSSKHAMATGLKTIVMTEEQFNNKLEQAATQAAELTANRLEEVFERRLVEMST